MIHYAQTGQVLGKGIRDLEGYTLEYKGYYGPGQMPVFEASFFTEMPRGPVDEAALKVLKQRFVAAGKAFGKDMIEEFKQEVAKQVETEEANVNLYMENVKEQDFL